MVKRTKKRSPLEGRAPTEIPAYTLQEVARYVQVPVSTLSYWVKGKEYKTKYGVSTSLPLIQLDEFSKKKNLLTFSNLVEAHVLVAIRREFNITMPKIREALDYVEKKMDTQRPLINKNFMTDGVSLFAEHCGSIVGVNERGQVGIPEVLSAYLSRIERDKQGLLRLLYPFTRDQFTLDQPKVIAIDPSIAFGKPHIAGTGVPTSSIWRRFKAGDSMAELVDDYRCSLNQIEEAIRCAPAEAA